MSVVLIAAPHPDDETLGAGGTLLRHIDRGHAVHWLIMSQMTDDQGFSAEHMRAREREISKVCAEYPFASSTVLPLSTTRLDTYPLGDIIGKVSQVFAEVQPNIIYVPFRGDAHSDHAVVYDAVTACTKWFRHPSVVRTLIYETVSETDFATNTGAGAFAPNVFIDISKHLDKKVAILQRCYGSELGAFPFPRSEEALRALATVRGAASGFAAAEAFMLLRDRSL